MSSGEIMQLAPQFSQTARKAAIWMLVAVLAWAPFPLGGAIAWGASLQEILIALCWIVWAFSIYAEVEQSISSLRIVLVPLVLALLVLGWACVQMLPIVPAAWAHPLWAMTSDILGQHIPATVSLNPWRTQAEILKLLSYLMACLLAFFLARRSGTAALLLNAVIAIGAFYALYAFILVFAGIGQIDFFYSVPYPKPYLSGPFMLHNSFATYSGLAALAAFVKLVAMGSESIVAKRGLRQLVLTTLQFAFGRGALILVAAMLCFSGVVASASRAGVAAMMCGLMALALVSLLIKRHTSTPFWTFGVALICLLPLLLLIVFSGDTLTSRIDLLLDAGTADQVRLALWDAAHRMILGAPWLGLGLGSFQDAYPLYAVQTLPFVMDKAHCDYLEFSAGLGLPAAVVWWTALVWLTVLCLRGVRVRLRHHIYPLLALGASVLIAVHSSVDFSLQLPAVSLFYATLMGIGCAQALPTRNIRS